MHFKSNLLGERAQEQCDSYCNKALVVCYSARGRKTIDEKLNRMGKANCLAGDLIKKETALPI